MGLPGLIQHLLTVLRQKHRRSPNLSGNAVLRACNLLILRVSTGSTPFAIRIDERPSVGGNACTKRICMP